MDNDTDESICAKLGTPVSDPIPHTCYCSKAEGHDATGGDPHQCVCGVKWTDELELASFCLTPLERSQILEFLSKADYATRMNAFSIDLPGTLVSSIAGVLRRLP